MPNPPAARRQAGRAERPNGPSLEALTGPDRLAALDRAVGRPYFSDGQTSVHVADALEVLPTLPEDVVDAVITDPPYTLGSASSLRANGWADTLNAARWYADWYAECARILRPDGVMWTLANWRSLPVVLRAADLAGMHIGSVAVWDKRWIGPGGSRGLRSRYELCVLMPMPRWRQPDRSAPDVWEIQGIVTRKPSGHPAEKPLDLLRHIVRLSALPAGGALVLDPFAGSGTTLAAAAEAGHAAFGVEAAAHWADTAVRRIAERKRAPAVSGGV